MTLIRRQFLRLAGAAVTAGAIPVSGRTQPSYPEKPIRILLGFAAALATTVLWILAAFVLPIFVPFLMFRVTGSTGAGVGAASIGSNSILAAALVGFAVGFSWQFRRLSKRRVQER